MAVLHSELNPFGGRIIDPDQLPDSPQRFVRDIAQSLDAWQADGIKVVWLQLPISRSDLVPLAVEAGFVYHHATEHWLQLTATLEDGSYVPPFATHYIGAGGVVIDESRRLLVIQERHHRHRHYKLPGGALYPGEHLADAVVREVREETGIETEFISIVCLRHWHGYRHGKSDIYFVTRLRPLSFEITPDPNEIADCFWMSVDAYLQHPDTHEFNRRIVQAALDLDRAVSAGYPVLRLGSIPDYGTSETHELFFPA